MNTELADIANQVIETIDADLEVLRAILDETSRDLEVLRAAIEAMQP